ncbi:hypothetical protein SOVF_148720 isoform A [Spinacia oleracea]|uniref:Uncharacterized protein LOC110798715 isoform X2 n=1 Tax=Spinacia oleracea TaxID=3562 RepID=A0A9R0J401_SPIOL|nr:uncharacterized protein LOC110798715 isoform X2 [Spinacia oleracea]XP_021859595.1 uncharacterized protein LOC110798715 isoform X2 [Spinacia oleracea]XP_056684437.1 uncharacterized protein LOC110798715 isoform X2 [Spinacia oleracea]KNA09965.1 hypothetical protein SOVF_148720 isoform A [Spinacia oleracea]
MHPNELRARKRGIEELLEEDYAAIRSSSQEPPQWSRQIRGVTRTDSEKKNLFFSYQESSGTHVLIPVPGGLVEMYSTKHVEEDESVLDYVKG